MARGAGSSCTTVLPFQPVLFSVARVWMVGKVVAKAGARSARGVEVFHRSWEMTALVM